VGRAELVAAVARSPMKRALRLDKMRLAALEAVLRLYADPARLVARLPTLRFLCRPLAEIEAAGRRLLPPVQAALAGTAEADLAPCRSQVGSGALPLDLLPSVALALAPAGPRRGGAVDRLAASFRALPIPVVGRIAEDRLLFDLRCLEDEAGFLGQLDRLRGA
jgi:L-seryl-tRNA(Ser) seleniumtransferase